MSTHGNDVARRGNAKRPMRPSTWLFWLTLGVLLVKSPALAAATADLLGAALWIAMQPPALVAILAAVAVHRVRSWAT